MSSQITLLKREPGWPMAEIQAEFMTFPGGEQFVKMPPLHPKTDDVYIVDARVSDAAGMMHVMAVADYFNRTAPEVTKILFMPYLPGARQDRGAPLSAATYADLINYCQFDRVIAVDPHSDVMPALIKNFRAIPAEAVFPRDLFPGPDKAVMLCPDQGATKRTEAVASRFGYQVIYARKVRDFQTGKLSGFTCDQLPDQFSDVIIVDDICDGGGTFLGLAPTIRYGVTEAHPHGQAARPKLHLWTTHGIYSKGLTALSNTFTTIASTDSFPIKEFAYTASPQGDQARAQGLLHQPLTRVSLRVTLQKLVDQTERMK